MSQLDIQVFKLSKHLTNPMSKFRGETNESHDDKLAQQTLSKLWLTDYSTVVITYDNILDQFCLGHSRSFNSVSYDYMICSWVPSKLIHSHYHVQLKSFIVHIGPMEVTCLRYT